MASPRPYQRIGDIGTDPSDYDSTFDLHALEFDGVDDYLDLTGLTVGVDRNACFGLDIAGANTYLFDSDNGRFIYLNSSSSGFSIYDGAFQTGAAYQVGVNVLSYLLSGTTATVRSNGIVLAGSVPYSPKLIGGNTALGSFHTDPGNNFIAGNIFSLVITENLNSIGDLESYTALKSGVSL